MTKRLPVTVSAVFVLTLVSSGFAEDFGTFIPMHEKGTATYYVTTEISGLGAVDVMVDTGSSYATINEETLDQLIQNDRAHYVHNFVGILADGRRTLVPVYSIPSINIDGQCALENIEVAVFPGKTRQLLGLSALRQASPFIFSVNPPQLVLSNCASGVADSEAESMSSLDPGEAVQPQHVEPAC